MRLVTNDDLWSAIRGLGMWSMERGELVSLRQLHVGNTEVFASRVISEAARQVLEARARTFNVAFKRRVS